jgi:hypothetical protein
MAAEYASVTVEAADANRVAEVYQIIGGSEPEPSADGFRIRFGNAQLRLLSSADDRGETAISLAVDDPDARARALRDVGLESGRSESELVIPADQANGIAVSLVPVSGNDHRPVARARLDHVAVRVRDLAEAIRRWAAITGVEGHDMGIHPVYPKDAGGLLVQLTPRVAH